MEPNSNPSLWQDPKFRWLVLSIVTVGVFEFLSLAGRHLPPVIGGPFFAVIIIAVGHHTLLNGFRALIRLNFKSINLLMVVAVVGAFYLQQYEEAAVVIVLFTLGERLEDLERGRTRARWADVARERMLAAVPPAPAAQTA